MEESPVIYGNILIGEFITGDGCDEQVGNVVVGPRVGMKSPAWNLMDTGHEIDTFPLDDPYFLSPIPIGIVVIYKPNKEDQNDQSPQIKEGLATPVEECSKELDW